MITEFPLFAFTTLGGLAAGAYAVSACFAGGEREAKRPWLFPLVCIALLGIGLLGVLGHLGRPERFLLALSNPTSMIAEEAYWSIAFGLLMLIDLVMLWKRGSTPRVVRILGAVCALVLMCIMANAYFTSYGNPAWAALPTLPLFVAGDLAMGAALYALFDRGLYRTTTFSVAIAVLAVAAAASYGAVGAHFAAYGHDLVPFAVAAVLTAAGAVVALLARSGKIPEKTAAWLAFALLFVGVAVARYAFYAASVL